MDPNLVRYVRFDDHLDGPVPEDRGADSPSLGLTDAPDRVAWRTGHGGNGERLDPGDTAGAAKGARDLELPPWSKGRYGSAVGRAVHGVLQVVDLATGEGLEQAVAAQSLAEGVLEHEDLVRSLARSALASDLVRGAAGSEHWRETYVGCPREDGTVLEGYIDLVFRDADGALVVVDYKTDAVPAGAIPSRVAYYQPQLDAYRDALAAATGAPVRTHLLFLHPDTATAVPV